MMMMTLAPVPLLLEVLGQGGEVTPNLSEPRIQVLSSNTCYSGWTQSEAREDSHRSDLDMRGVRAPGGQQGGSARTGFGKIIY